MRTPPMRYAALVAFAFAFVTTPHAQQLTQPPAANAKGPSRTIQFNVAVEPEALHLRKEFLEDKSVITHVTMTPASGEPVFYPDEPGWPSLPRLTRLVAIPAGAKVQAVSIKPGKTITIPDVSLVAWASLTQPGQKQPGDNPNDPKNRYPNPPELTIDNNKQPVYYPFAPSAPHPDLFKLTTYPETIATQDAIQQHSRVAGVLRLDVSPVQWQVAKGELTLTTDFSVTITLDGNVKFDRPKSPGEANMLDDLRGLVVNPGDLPVFVFDPRPIDVPYLIITDDNYWTSDFERTPGANLVAEFEPLAQWKREKGVPATVVRISDIVDGRYGNFRDGARDLQETIRNFLKYSEARHHTQWVLLGGDTDVVPPRHVSVWGHVNAAHYHQLASDVRPTPGHTYWDSAHGRALINTSLTGFTHLISPRSGRTFTEAAHPTEASPGWRVVSSALCNMTGAPAGSRCLEVIAPAADIENTNMAFALRENTLPTDLYYSSLHGADYGTPDRHDWDLNNDGLYGTNLWDRSADGVSYWPTLRLGRAPASTAAEARSFVQKVIGYERYVRSAGFAGKHLLTADNWSGPPTARRGTENPPPEGRSVRDAARGFGIAHFASAPSSAADWRIVAWNSADSWIDLAYTRDAGPGVEGWYFCSDATCLMRSEFLWPSGIFGPWVWVPFPTRYVKIETALTGYEDAAFYFFDYREPDSAVQEKEEVKTIYQNFFPGLDERQRLYKDIYDIPPAPDLSELFIIRVTEAFFRGVNIASLSGHGWYGGCCGLDFAQVPGLDLPGTAAGLVYVDSCLTNEFDQPAGDAVSELMLNQEFGGAVAYVGNTRYSWIGLGSSFERSFWLRMRSTRHVGVLHNSKAGYTHNPNEQWTNFSLNMMGDPEMEVWREEPRTMRFTDVAREVFQGSRIRGRVVDQTTGAGVPLARVTLTGSGVQQTKIADLSGNFEFLPAGRPGDVLKVTATHIIFEYKPVSSDVRVTERVLTLIPRPGVPPPLPGRP